MSHAIESVKALHSQKVADLFSTIQIVPKLPLVGEAAFAARSSIAKGHQLDLILLKYRHLLDSLIYGNSFVGNDYFILRYVSYELLLYWHILSEGSLSKEDMDSCKLEVETHFYLYLNSIYNLKEKFERLTDYRHGHVGELILTDAATQSLETAFSTAYPSLQRCCEARGFVVHGLYAIALDSEHAAVYVSCSPFDLLPRAIHTVPSDTLQFSLQDDAIVSPVRAIYSLTESVLDVLRLLDNVDPDRLAKKFFRSPGTFAISF